MRLGINLLLASTLGLGLAGCGETSKKASKDVRETANNLFLSPRVNGTWTNECHGSSILKASTKETFQFHGNNLEKVLNFYSTDQCVEKVATVTYKGTYSLAKDSERSDKYRYIDLTYDKAYVEVHNDKGRKLLETIHFCGHDSWPVGKQIELTNKTDNTLCPLATTPRTEFDLVKQDGDKLLFGKGGDAAPTAKNERPADVKSDVVFKRD